MLASMVLATAATIPAKPANILTRLTINELGESIETEKERKEGDRPVCAVVGGADPCLMSLFPD